MGIMYFEKSEDIIIVCTNDHWIRWLEQMLVSHPEIRYMLKKNYYLPYNKGKIRRQLLLREICITYILQTCFLQQQNFCILQGWIWSQTLKKSLIHTLSQALTQTPT